MGARVVEGYLLVMLRDPFTSSQSKFTIRYLSVLSSLYMHGTSCLLML
jgi:hypothetical protein